MDYRLRALITALADTCNGNQNHSSPPLVAQRSQANALYPRYLRSIPCDPIENNRSENEGPGYFSPGRRARENNRWYDSAALYYGWPMGRIAKRVIISALCAPVVVAAGAALIFLVPRYHQPIILGDTTTFITKPLHADGTPNYLAAFNAIAGRNVKPDENAGIPLIFILRPHEPVMVPFWRREVNALGVEKSVGQPRAIGSTMAFFNLRFPDSSEKRLPLGGKGGASQNPRDWMQYTWMNNDKASRISGEELHLADRQPWVPHDASVLAAYLDANAAALEEVRHATALPRFYLPLVADRRHFAAMAFANIPWLAQCRRLSHLLLAQADLDLGRGRISDCEADLIAIHRLGRLLVREPRLIIYLVGLSIDRTADKGDRVLMRDPLVHEKDAAEYLHRLSSLRPIGAIRAALDVGERMTQLDICISLYRETFDTSGRYSKDETNGRFFNAFINWNPTLIQINKSYNLLGRFASVPVYSRRAATFRSAMQQMLEKIKARRFGLLQLPNNIEMQALGTDFRDGVRFCDLAAREAACTRLTRVGFALQAYQLHYGKYPTSLAALRPQYIRMIPRNPLTGKPLAYNCTGGTCVVSAAGPVTRDRPRSRFGRGLTIRLSAPAEPVSGKVRLP